MPGSSSSVAALVRFARLVSEELEAARVLRVLADAAVEDVGAAAAGVFCITDDGGARLVAARDLPAEAEGLTVEAIGPELEEALQAACGRRFEVLRTLPLVSGGDLFGALVLAFAARADVDAARAELVQALVDQAAVALRTAAQFQALRRSYAELREARELLGRAEKLGALGHMAAGIAHDLANVFAPLVGDAENLKANPPTERVGKAAARMSRYLKVGTDMVERLRRFARQAPEAGHVAIDPAPAVRDAVDMCAARGRERPGPVDVRLALEPLPSVVVSPSDLTSALVNLIVNAIDAQPDGGSVEVRGGECDAGAWLEVADAGPGIPEELQRRMFEPFFTTKGERGTGLGLANVYAFVQRHRGTVVFRSPPGDGTTFRLEFPRA